MKLLNKMVKYFYYDDFITGEIVLDIFIGKRKIKTLRFQKYKLYKLMENLRNLKGLLKGGKR